MSIIETLKEYFRPKLKIKQNIVEREKKFNEQDSGRKKWMLEHTYLCRGGFEQLRQEKNYEAFPRDKLIYFPNYKTPKKVIVKADNPDLLEDMLKEELFLRGCNAGIYYKISKEGNYSVAEAVPAIISSE